MSSKKNTCRICPLYLSLTLTNSFPPSSESKMTVKDCFVGVISSHGEEGVVFGADGCAVKLAEIYSYFGGPSMADKSKLFLIQVRFMKTLTNLFYSSSCRKSCTTANIDGCVDITFLFRIPLLCHLKLKVNFWILGLSSVYCMALTE